MATKIASVAIHPSITTERVLALVEAQFSSTDNPGICIECGEDADGCEPDARHYLCEACGKHGVYGAEEILLYIA
jgi:predicted amidophosphoribosyltransferase